MRRHVVLGITLMFVCSIPLTAMAMSHEKQEGHDHSMHDMKMDDSKHGSSDHSMHEHMEHGGGMMEGMMMLGNVEQDGVRAMAHIKAYDMATMEKMQKMGMSATHHFMVMFVDIATGKPINDGMAAVKVQPQGGEASDAVKLMNMDGGFGGDIIVPAGKPATLTVGTKVRDEKKRQFEFELAK